MELSLLTDAFIMISVYDENEKRVTTFQSHEIEPEFNEMTVMAHERFRPGDVGTAFQVCKEQSWYILVSRGEGAL